MLLVLDTGAEFLKIMTYVTVHTYIELLTMETYGQLTRRGYRYGNWR